ncbi:phosphopantetheine-binding protein, partial [Streptomyces sp. SID6139]|nr:hypothetical protein [Streptomyces sp. SID6139]
RAERGRLRRGPAGGGRGEGGRGGPGAEPVVVEAVVGAVAEVGGYPAGELTRGARFYEDLGFDSVMIMQLKDRIEARLPQVGELAVPDLIPALRSIDSLAVHLAGLVPAGATPGKE